MLTILLGIAVVAAMGGAAAALVYADERLSRWREHRRRIRAWRWALRDLHSGHVDDLPRTGGPSGGERAAPDAP